MSSKASAMHRMTFVRNTTINASNRTATDAVFKSTLGAGLTELNTTSPMNVPVTSRTSLQNGTLVRDRGSTQSYTETSASKQTVDLFLNLTTSDLFSVYDEFTRDRTKSYNSDGGLLTQATGKSLLTD